MIKRFLYPGELVEGKAVTFDQKSYGDELKHLRKVLRAKTGDSIEIINGQGLLAKGNISSISSSDAIIEIQSIVLVEMPKPNVCVVQGFLKGQRMDWCIEKLTEMGVSDICITSMEKSATGKKEFDSRLDRWKRLCASAMKQSGNPFFPSLKYADSLESALASFNACSDLILYGAIDSSPRAAVSTILANLDGEKRDRIFLVIGPESGLSSSEVDLLQKLESSAAYLGNTTLRSETATLMMAGIVNNWVSAKNEAGR